jgi:hypothetical protein
MEAQCEVIRERRRFLVINFRIGTRENGYLIGPALVSTSDYARFHFWDEPCAAEFDADEYEIVKLYQRGLSYDEATRQFAKEFPLVFSGPWLPGWSALSAAGGAGEPRYTAIPQIVAA